MHNATKIETLARGVLVDGRGRILLCRDLRRDYLYLPGGHVEPGETAASALLRELAEETDLPTARLAVGGLGLVAEQLFEQRGTRRHEYSLVFHVEHTGGSWPESVESRERRLGFEWVERAALVDADVRPTAVKAWLVAGGRGSGAEWVGGSCST